jgi:predicted transcriptional regulator of viral defense system
MNRDVLLRDLKVRGLYVFTPKDVMRLTGVTRASTNVLLHRLARDGWVIRAGRGVYTLVDDPLVVGTSVVSPSYVTFVAAYHFHNVVEQMPFTTTVAAARTRRPLATPSWRVEFVQLRSSLMFGFRLERVSGAVARIAGLEKAVVDSLYMPRRALFKDTLRALRECERSILEEHTERSGIEAVRRRVGFLLERVEGSTSIKPEGRTVHILNPARKRRGRFDARWRMYINEEV